jgi:uncharacterized membrane protein YqaE (UPF0057 family)
MNDFSITIIFILLTLLGIHVNNKMKKIEHFASVVAAIPDFINAIVSFFVNFVDLFMVLVDAIINFVLSIVDLFMILVESLQWIGKLPGWLAMLVMNIVNIFFDLLTIIVLWLNPVTLIRSIVRCILTFVKIIFLMVMDIVLQFVRIVTAAIFSSFRGGMWGLPHEPKHHIKHSNRTGYLNKNDLGGYYHHHKHPEPNNPDKENNGKNWDPSDPNFSYQLNHKYRSMRCYRTMTSEGYLNIIATIICPPLGVFMSFGLMGMFKILVCAALTLYYYIPGLVYAFLITSHLGIGMQLKFTDCGGEVGGLTITGCEKRTTEGLCKDATIPDKTGKDGTLIPACIWTPDLNNEYGGTCGDTVIRGTNYADMVSGAYHAEDSGGTNDQEANINISGNNFVKENETSYDKHL